MTAKEIVKVHKVLSDLTRWEIFNYIWHHDNVSGKALLSEFGVSQPILSFHINKLEDANLITINKIGQTHYCQVNVKLIETTVQYRLKELQLYKKTKTNLMFLDYFNITAIIIDIIV